MLLNSLQKLFQAHFFPFRQKMACYNFAALYFCGAAGGIVGNVFRPLTTNELPQQPEEGNNIIATYL